MKTPTLSNQDVQVLAQLARSDAFTFLRERVLRPWLADIDATLRKAGRNDFQAVQGNAQAVEHVINLLSPQEVKRPPTRRLVVDGEAMDIALSARKPVPRAGLPT